VTTSFKNWTIFVLTLIVLTGIFFAGYFTYKGSHPCLIRSDTTYVTDTVVRTIKLMEPFLIVKLDTVILTKEIPAVVDTAAILQLYYSTYEYTRTFEDSTLKAVLWDRVTQNKPAVISFDYTIKRPQQIIQQVDNSVSYNSYVYIGGSIPLYEAKRANLGVFVASNRGLFGVAYIPAQNSFNVTGAFKIIKIR
jgi:hypothetical protein